MSIIRVRTEKTAPLDLVGSAGNSTKSMTKSINKQRNQINQGNEQIIMRERTWEHTKSPPSPKNRPGVLTILSLTFGFQSKSSFQHFANFSFQWSSFSVTMPGSELCRDKENNAKYCHKIKFSFK